MGYERGATIPSDLEFRSEQPVEETPASTLNSASERHDEDPSRLRGKRKTHKSVRECVCVCGIRTIEGSHDGGEGTSGRDRERQRDRERETERDRERER